MVTGVVLQQWLLLRGVIEWINLSYHEDVKMGKLTATELSQIGEDQWLALVASLQQTAIDIKKNPGETNDHHDYTDHHDE